VVTDGVSSGLPESFVGFIRDIVETGRLASADEVRQIIAAMAVAPFSTRRIRVSASVREVDQTERLGARADSLAVHLFKRIWLDRQWTESTSVDDFLGDVAVAVKHPTAMLLAYRRQGRLFTASISFTTHVVPEVRRGADAGRYPLLVVVYDVEEEAIVTAYMFSSIQTLNLPGDVRWLK